MDKKTQANTLDAANAQVMADLVTDESTTDTTRVRILGKLLEGREGQNFFQTIFEELLGFGPCPGCGHENHWAVPEDELNQMGYVTADHDPRVKRNTTRADCPEFEEACGKKKVLM